MGCTTSKLDDLRAVALCRERCAFLDEAIRQRFALAEAHIAYVNSLKGIGSSLHNFIEQSPASASPELSLPPQRKGEKAVAEEEGEEAAAEAIAASRSTKKGHIFHHFRSNSGSHLDFHSDSEEEDGDDDISHLHHSGHSSPLHDGGGGGIEYIGGGSDYMHTDQGLIPSGGGFFSTGGGVGGGGGFLHMNYMKNKATPSVVYEQRPVTSETVRFGEASSSSSYYYSNNYPYPVNNPSPYSNFGYPNYGAGGGAMGGYYGSPPYGSSSQPQDAVASSSKPPPPPPSPSRASAWDFLNPFDGYDKYYPWYTPGRDSNAVREEEGIPDLEDEEYQHEVVKEVHGHEKYIDGGVDAGQSRYAKSVMMDDVRDGGKVGGGSDVEASLYQVRPGVSIENDRMGYEVPVVDKKVVDDGRNEDLNNAGFKVQRDVSDVAVEIKIQFERASESGTEITKLLEVGRVPYQRKHVSKMLQAVTPSLYIVSSHPSTSTSTDKADPVQLQIDEELVMRSKNLSSTLHKLYLWEKKLYNDVKVEEKMRVAYEKKCRKLKHLDERGAEAHKVDATRTLIRSLSTKIRMAIQVVDKISVTLNKIRDEELWPQLNDLIQGLTRMWKCMLECHHSQCEVIREAKNFGPIGSGKKLSDAHLGATLQLARELIHWTSNFSSWIGAQRGYVKALNGWLVQCLSYEPEETPDGVPPFSPGRMGAPPVFVICNQWALAMDRISEKEVIEAMHIFTMSVFQLWDPDKPEMRQRMMANKDLERKVRNLDREHQKIQKEIQAPDKKIVLAGDGNSLSLTSNISNSSLQGSLQRIFEAMERFMGESMKAYEELIQRSEEETSARDRETVS